MRLLNGTQSSSPLLSFCYFRPSLVGGCFIHQCTKSQSPPPLCLPSFSLSLHSRCLSFSPRNRGQLCGAVQYLFSLLSRLSTCLHARTPARESATSPRNAPATLLPLQPSAIPFSQHALTMCSLFSSFPRYPPHSLTHSISRAE